MPMPSLDSAPGPDAAARHAGRRLSLTTRAAIGLTVVGPSVLCIALLTMERDKSEVQVVHEAESPAQIQEAVEPASTIPPEPEPPVAVAEPVEAPEPVAPEILDASAPMVAAMTPWGVVLSNDADASWGRGKIAAIGYGPEARSTDVAAKEVELAHLPAALRARVGTQVIGYGSDGEVCRGVIGTPRLVKVFNGWQDMLGEQEPRLYNDDDGETPKVSARVIRNAVWAHVEEAWLVAPVLTDGSCDAALMVTSTNREASPLVRHDDPVREGEVAARVEAFLASRPVRAMKRDYESYRADLGKQADTDPEGVTPYIAPPWNTFVKKNLRVRAFQTSTGELAAVGFSLTDNDAQGCGEGFWQTVELLERRESSGEWLAIGQTYPDAAIRWEGGWMDASRDFEMGVGTNASVRLDDQLPAFHKLMAKPITEDDPQPAHSWESATAEDYSAIAYFEGCPC